MEQQDANCIFCKIVRGEIPSERVYEGPEVIAFRDIQPQAPVHILVIPRHHVASLHDASEHVELLGTLLATARTIAEQEGLGERGYRVITNSGPDSGQLVAHLHLHILGGKPLGYLVQPA